MEQTTVQLFAEVRARLEGHDGQGAIELLWPYISENHSDAMARSLYGMALFTAGHTDAGIAELRQATILQPDGAQLHFNLAVALFQSGDKTAAQTECEEALRLDPSHASAGTMLRRLQNLTVTEQPNVVQPPIAPLQVTSQREVSYGPAQSPSSPVTNGALPSGMIYTPPVVEAAPNSVRAIKGLTWGAGYGQYWTLWSIVWMAVDAGSHAKSEFLIAYGLIYGVACALVGALVGLFIFVKRTPYATSVMAGLVGGLALMGFEFMLYHERPIILVNVIFWAFTGRFVGRLIGRRSLRTP